MKMNGIRKFLIVHNDEGSLDPVVQNEIEVRADLASQPEFTAEQIETIPIEQILNVLVSDDGNGYLGTWADVTGSSLETEIPIENAMEFDNLVAELHQVIDDGLGIYGCHEIQELIDKVKLDTEF